MTKVLQALLVLVMLSTPAAAQTLPGMPGSESATPGEVPADPLGRSTPRGMVDGLLAALAAADTSRAVRYLDLSAVPETQRPERGARLVAALQTVLDRTGGILPSYRFSSDPQGDQADGLEGGKDAFALVRGPAGFAELTAHRVPGPDGTEIWLVSPEALQLVQQLAWIAVPGWIERITPDGWEGVRIAGAPVGDWLAMAVVALLSLAVARTTTLAVFWLGGRVWNQLRGAPAAHLGRVVLLPLGLFVACALFALATAFLGISVVARAHVAPLLEIVSWLALAWLVWRAVDGIATVGLGSLSRKGRLGAISVVTLLRRAGKLLIVAIAALAVFNSLGLNLTGWIAALGIGGLAIALGAQKTIEHFVGSLTLIADQPVRVGDFCQVDGLLGTVEDIGMRSTRIRTLDRTLVTIPNGIMSGARIENYTSRDLFWFHPVLAFRYETTPDQIRYLLVELRAMLYAHPRVDPDPARVRLLGLGADCLNVEVFAYVRAGDYNDFLEVQEDLTLRIMDIVAAGGASFAFPSRTIYIASDPAAADDKRATAESRVRDWTATNDLQLPRFQPDRIAALKGSLSYPPEGSAMHPKPGKEASCRPTRG